MERVLLKPFGIAAAIAAALAIGAASTAVALPLDGQLGGPPDPSFIADDTLCPEGAAVTGVKGFTRIIGGFIPIVAVATVQCTFGTATTMGSGGGEPGSTNCPDGKVAVGISGREGDFIDLLELRCRDAETSGLITPSDGQFGGGLGVPDGPYDCPAGTSLRGLEGQSVPGSEDTIRWVQIVCETTKEACKDGGWKQFGFKHQGQCVRFVETGKDSRIGE